MMLISLGLCNARKQIHAMGCHTPAATARGGAPGPLVRANRRRAALIPPLRQLVWRFRSQWRHSVRAGGRRVRFGYDPESYSQNFDDSGGAVFVVSFTSPRRLI